MISDIQILQLLSSLTSQQSINKLVEACFKIALNVLRFNYKKVHNIILRDELSLDDVAIDSIASLFLSDENGKFTTITSAFNSWQPPIKTEDDALYFLNKLIQKRVEQHISFILRESDPIFSKIMDSVNYLIKKQDYKKASYLGTIYIINSDHNELGGKNIPIDEFEKLPPELFIDKINLFSNLFNYISNDIDYSSAIPFNALIYKLKELNIALYKVSESTEEQSETFEINTVINLAVENTFKKLNETYLTKGKLSEEEVKIFRRTIKDMAEDLKDGGVNPGLYKYLSVHFDGLTEECYKQKYHNILEYLSKLLKQNIADQLME